MATTPNYALVYPTTANQITPLATHFANLASSVDTAMANSASRMIGTDSARTSLTAPQRKEGLEYYASDTKREWKYNGSAWAPNKSGLISVYPTSVTGPVSLQADGSIRGNTVADSRINIDGCFTTDYNHYRIVLSLQNKNGINPTMSALVRTGAGTDYAAAGYYNQQSTLQGNTPANYYTAAANTLGNVFDDSGIHVISISDILVGPNLFEVFNTTMARGGNVSQSYKSAGVEGMPSRGTGLGIATGQTVGTFQMNIYAYA